MSIGSATAWRLERDDRVATYASTGGVRVFAETTAMAVDAHDMPAWKLVLPDPGGTVVLDDGSRTFESECGVLVAPHHRHRCATTRGYTAVFVDPWHTRRRADRALTPVDPSTTGRLRDILRDGEQVDATDAPRALSDLFGDLGPLGPIGWALLELDGDAEPAAVAAATGLSAPRARAIVRAELGTTLGRIRRWRMLMSAIERMPAMAVADAAHTAGFADQPHLTRVSREMVGRTPGSLRR